MKEIEKKIIFFGKSSSIRAGQGIVFFKNILVFEKSTVFPIEKLSQAFASPLPCGQGIGKGAQPDTAESSGRRRKPEPWKARFLRTSPQKWPLKKSGNTFQQMKEVFAELIRKGKCIEEIKVLREIYKYVRTHESLANRAALGSMISLIFTLAALKHDKHIELPQNPSLEDIFRIVKDGSQEDIDYIFATWSNHRYDGVFNYDIEWFERLLPEEEQDS